MLELTLVIAIVLILAALTLPAFQRARVESLRARSMAQIATNLKLVEIYCQASKDVYPIASKSINYSMLHWYEPLMNEQLIRRETEIDPYRSEAHDSRTYAMSTCMVRDWQEMQPDRAIRESLSITHGVATHEVSFPSSKGAMVQFVQPYLPEYSRSPASTAWCCGLAIKAPVGFADGSVSVHAWQELKRSFEEIDGVGLPVIATWYGVRGIDR
jgi:Tfp pilus assembly protein PilE